MRVIAEHARQMRIGALVESEDGRQLAADEQGLEHHMVPGVLVKLLPGIRIAVGDRLKNRLHGTARAFAGAGNMLAGIGKDRETPIKGDQFPDVGGVKERFQPRLERLAIASLSRQYKSDAGGLVDAPVRGIPVGPRHRRGGTLLGLQFKIALAKLTRGIAEGEVDVLFAVRRLEPLDLAKKPISSCSR